MFVALWPSAGVAETLMELERHEVAGVRWTTPERWHVTLAFFGAVEVEEVEAMEAALVSGLTGAAAPEVRLGPATCRLGRSVLCVPASGAESLAHGVQAALARVAPNGGRLEGEGGERPQGGGPFESGGAPFLGHLTVARARGGRMIPRSLCGVAVDTSWRAREVRLVRSDLGPSGARYRVLAKVTVGTIQHRTDVRD